MIGRYFLLFAIEERKKDLFTLRLQRAPIPKGFPLNAAVNVAQKFRSCKMTHEKKNSNHLSSFGKYQKILLGIRMDSNVIEAYFADSDIILVMKIFLLQHLQIFPQIMAALIRNASFKSVILPTEWYRTCIWSVDKTEKVSPYRNETR